MITITEAIKEQPN